MAVRYYGASIGAQKAVDVTEAASTTSAVIELAVTYTTSGMSKHHVANALSALREYILQDEWPPNT